MKCARFLAAMVIGLTSSLAGAQTVFTQWDFDASGPVGPADENGIPTIAPFFSTGLIYNNPVPTTGNGIATPLGMDNNYVFANGAVGSVANCDVLSTAGAPSLYTISAWRVRGPSNNAAFAGNGWSTAAPQKSQGAQFLTSTVGLSGIRFSCQLFCTTQGVSAFQTQYTTDGSTWTDIGPIRYTASNDYYPPAAGTLSNSNPGITLDFTGIPAANNNPNFGVRIVSVWDPRFTGAGSPNYGSAQFQGNPTATPVVPGQIYNNSSGNWRFGLVTFTADTTGALNPVIRASTDVNAICGQQANTVAFRASIQPGSNPPSTGITVRANLSSVGGSSNQLLTGNAESSFFVYSATIPANTVTFASGQTTSVTRTVPITVTDAQGRTATSNALLTFVPCGNTTSTAAVVISQVYGGGGNTDPLNASNQGVFDADFVEIYNRSASPVNLTGWSVQYASPASAGGFNNPNNRVTLSGTLQPQQYALIRYSDPAAGFSPLPTPDFSTVYGFGGIGNTGGRVALCNTTNLIGTSFTSANVIDLVGYGAAAITFEGAGAAPTPNNANAVIRKFSGPAAQDSNQNFNDFTLATPTPRNRGNNGTTSFLTAYASIPNPDPTGTVIVTPSACAGSTVLLTCRVIPGSAAISSVVANVADVAGSGSVTLNDNGLNGDVSAGDGVYSVNYLIPSAANTGARSIPVTVTDAASASASSTIALTIGTCADSGAPVVISQVFGGGGNLTFGFARDFVQLYNRSSSPVDLTGWQLQYATNSAPFDALRVIPLSGVINPGEYRIASGQLADGVGIAIPTIDFLPAVNFGIDNQFGRLALVRPLPPNTTASIVTASGTGFVEPSGVVDSVGYGKDIIPTYEGVAPVGTLSNSTVAIRKNNGDQDLNQNLIDFDVKFISIPASSTRTLTVTKAGSGSGTVTSLPDGITCGSSCTRTFTAGSMVMLTAEAAQGSQFTGWSGACTGTGPCVLTLSSSTTVTANFTGACPADADGNGQIEVADIFAFLSRWFANDIRADIDGNNQIQVADIFAFLSRWFAGC